MQNDFREDRDAQTNLFYKATEMSQPELDNASSVFGHYCLQIESNI